MTCFGGSLVEEPLVGWRDHERTSRYDRGACASCGRSLENAVFIIGGRVRCLRCAATDRAMLWRSARVAMVVGSILVVINQGIGLTAGEFRMSLAWQIPLTYAVPFCVATWSALSTSRKS